MLVKDARFSKSTGDGGRVKFSKMYISNAAIIHFVSELREPSRMLDAS